MNITDEMASTHLGKKSSICDKYDKSLLVAIPRVDNRIYYGINEDNLPFVGFDIWDAYEVSFLTTNNVPINRVLKIKYPCTSPFIVESKSLKLYLNSFNMTPLKETINESIDFFCETVKKDLSELLNTDVEIALHDSLTSNKCNMFVGYENLNKYVDLDSIKCEVFNEAPHLLEVIDVPCDIKLTFDCLRSNCRVTHQPDFGDLFIYIKANKSVTYESLFKYLVSFRKEYHFHEECVEMIYKRLFDILHPEILMVAALYTRRGGIDICPIRALKYEYLDNELIDINKFTKRTIKQ